MTEGVEWRVQDSTQAAGYDASAPGETVNLLLGLGKKSKFQ